MNILRLFNSPAERGDKGRKSPVKAEATVRWPIHVVIVATIVGGYLRLANLGVAPYWIDEVLFVNWVNGGGPTQEFIPITLAKLLGLHGEFWIRLPFALAGALTVPLVYLMANDKKLGACAALFVATFPLFVFWSRLARPYSFAGLFIVLGWRYPWAYFGAVLTTPMALIGLDVGRIKKLWPLYGALGLIAVGTYLVRSDVSHGSNFFDVHFLTTVRRLWYVPCLTAVLYLCRYSGSGGIRGNTKPPKG